ncbi:hypothetical protein [Pseudonocardia sp. GCM10023141]|uniref:hypothetical protein n=1 Tax=Pseudonocardia sp. GCM10023141 TaxID=3252653 RepID=UPI00361BDA78
MRVRRFFCDNNVCPRKTFAEQVPGLSAPHARRTPLLRAMVEWIAMAVGGRPGRACHGNCVSRGWTKIGSA